MLQFYNGVYDFFSEEHKLVRNEDIKKLSEISDYIFTLASDFKQNPSCKIIYITTKKSEDEPMAIAKVVEVNSSSVKSFEDAIQTGIAKVTETVKNVQGAWINEQKVVVKDNKIVEYRVNLKISFLVD